MSNKIYTKGGDKGETSLLGGKRVPKYHPRVEAYGNIDELSSFIGLLRSTINEHSLQTIAILRDKRHETERHEFNRHETVSPLDKSKNLISKNLISNKDYGKP